MKSTTEFNKITVFGARGHSLMILRGLQEYWRGRVKVRALIDDVDNGHTHPGLGIPVISSDQRLSDYPDLPVLVTPGSGSLRAQVIARLAGEGATLATAICPDQVHVDPEVTYGFGSIVTAHTRLGPAVRIGDGAQVLATMIAHDVEIGAFSNLNVHSSVLGHVIIGREVNIAPYAVIGNGTRERPLRIGDGAVIGVGAVVVRDVPEGARMVGNPAMSVERWKALNRLIDGT
ncbi:acetyltransferase [Paracoccus methylovorus]|uniref:Acetyltransferase n=1 Tax=Paracoccus methylovorus TaxID=2812658 RepID=A0ABX7JNW0_9RHOB|nr:acetyltransferase [Paracoccus methylovorus]QRZ14928.1 acetyltransferase [Paracoccus methylovorus]